jgi:hypothetical protein
LPASSRVSGPSVPVADRGSEEINVGFSDLRTGSSDQLRDPRLSLWCEKPQAPQLFFGVPNLAPVNPETFCDRGYAGLTFGVAKFVCFTLVSFQNDSKVTGLAGAV